MSNKPWKWVIGTDEAGYGPNLGPLVVSASLWKVPATLSVEQMADRLRPALQPGAAVPAGAWIPLGDSKTLYRGRSDLQPLAESVLELLSLCTHAPHATRGRPDVEADGGEAGDTDCSGAADGVARLAQLVRRCLSSADRERLERRPWYTGWGEVPTAVVERPELVQSASRHLAAESIELCRVVARVVDEQEFNLQVERLGNKAELLSRTTFQLAADLIREIEGEKISGARTSGATAIELWCDRHGGRRSYAGKLMEAFDGGWFQASWERAESSRYRASWSGVPMEVELRTAGDALPPCGLASVVAKLIRELAMHQLNRFWQRHLPDLRPTAGYPVDAARFADQIGPTAANLQLERCSWWRSR
jgi:hypothetical protein